MNQHLLCALLFISLPRFCSAQESSIPEQNWEMVKIYLDDQKDFSGIIMLGEHGKIKLNQGYGFTDRENKIPFTDQTLSTIGSITKPFTATAILLLYNEGKVSLQDYIGKYFEGVPPDKREITIHHLLTHSSGLPGAIGDDYESISDEEFRQRAWEEPLLFNPGTGYAYSNVGYSLLGMIIEKISGSSYSTFLREKIFNPAGMPAAGYKYPKADYRRLTHGYMKDGTDWGTSHDKNWNGDEPYWHLKANGGLLMSASDMFQWYLALRENKVLTPDLLKLQTTPYADEGGGSYYGYGYAVDQKGECVQHNGGNRIFKADFRWFPKSDYFLYSTTNDANVRLFRINDEIIQILETGALPEVDNWIEIPPGEFPANENQETAQAFITLIQTYTNDKGKTFIPGYFSADMVRRNGEQRLLDLFGMLHADADQGSPTTVYASGEKIMVVLPADRGKARLKISLSMLEHKIDRLSAEIEGL